MQNLGTIDETVYLSTINSSQYRRIMRIFYLEYEKMNFQLYKEDILEQIHREDESYNIEQLKQDLESLVKWKNLIPIQDPGRVYTIADYKNKQYRYSMSEYAVEIERMTVKLENLFLESGNLSTNFFVRLAKNLNEASNINKSSLKEVNEWWEFIQEDFKHLNQNYQDYLRDFYSGKSDKLMKSVEFIIHKDRFIQYLTDFIRELQHHSREIEKILKQQSKVIEEEILHKVIKSELDIPHATFDNTQNLESSIRENVEGKWKSLKNWFVDNKDHECECKKVLQITNDIIRNIIQNASLIVQLKNWGISRKDDYQKFLELFLNSENLEEAHKISAHVFGVYQIEHFKSNEARDSDSINESVYEESAMEYCLKPRVKTYREKKNKEGFADKSIEKYLQKTAYLKKIQMEEELVMRYIKDNNLDFSAIDDIVSENVRSIFLQWITQANSSSLKKGRTQYGQEYFLKRKEGMCVLHCEDGDLTMPAYVLEFKHE